MHAQLHLSEPHMYLFDLEANPSESVVDGCGTDKNMGPPTNCGSLYDIPAFRSVRRKLEGILSRAERDSVAPTLRWTDDGPLADPLSFGGWLPWRDRAGDPLAHYEGVLLDSAQELEEGQDSRVQVSLADIGVGGVGREPESHLFAISAVGASWLAMFAAIVAVGATIVAYRAGQRSGYRPLFR